MLSYRMIIVGKPLEKIVASNSWVIGLKHIVIQTR